jgi:hypothetical protein
MPKRIQLHANDCAAAPLIMAENPSEMGWQRLSTRGCGGRHDKPPLPGEQSTILWRRRRNYFDPDFRRTDPSTDAPLWVAEQVGTTLCVTDRWALMQRVIATSPTILRDIGQPWTISPGDIQQGSTVTLTVENGRWVWELTGDPAPCCGGYLARWPD